LRSCASLFSLSLLYFFFFPLLFPFPFLSFFDFSRVAFKRILILNLLLLIPSGLPGEELARNRARLYNTEA
jgi:hypothetical protein